MNQNKITNQLFLICSKLIGKKDKKSLLQNILNSAVKIIKADRGTVFLLNSKRGKRYLRSVVATGIEDRVIEFEVGKGIASRVLKQGQPIIVDNVKDCSYFYEQIDEETGYETKSILSVPLKKIDGETIGVIEILNPQSGSFKTEDLQVLQIFSLFSGVAIDSFETGKGLKEHKERIWQLTNEQMAHTKNLWISSNHQGMIDIYSKLQVYGESDSNILIEGESGTGKEGITRLIHLNSFRDKEPFVVVNCAAIPETLFEAEFFGVAKGAATGTSERKGKLILANGGTLFLDEVGELNLQAQAKLLRVLQDKCVTPVGSEEAPVEMDFRLICATNRNLEQEVSEKRFREDLYYRLNVIQIELPPLRDRKEDIPEIAKTLLDQFTRQKPTRVSKEFSPSALDKLKNYDWPGNIRQLQNKIENAFIISENSPIVDDNHIEIDLPTRENESPQLVALPTPLPDEKMANYDLKQAKQAFEKRLIFHVIQECGGNKSEAARRLGISREGLRKALKKAS